MMEPRSAIRQWRGAVLRLLVATSALSAPTFSARVGAQPLGQSSVVPRVEAMTLQLTDKSTTELGLVVTRAERKRIGDATKLGFRFEDGEFELREDPEPITVTGQDGKKFVGTRFVTRLPLDLDALEALNADLKRTQIRSMPTFAPGGREVTGRLTLPEVPIDLARFRRGEMIHVLPFSGFRPLPALGGIAVASINKSKSLTIASLPVIEDPGRTFQPCAAAAGNTPLKTWTFGHLMEQMSQGSGLTPGEFVENWLEHWKVSQTVHDSTGATVVDGISALSATEVETRILQPWRDRSGPGPLDLSIAPFRLQAILYRPDLGHASPYAGSTGDSPGELRFVFGFVEARDNNHDGDALDLGECVKIEAAAIFEYGIPISSCGGIKKWANEFAGLSSLLLGSPAYGTKLEELTEQVVRHGAAPAKPNQNAINQLRTNEIEFSQIWQFREFHLAPSGVLEQAITRNNPREHQAPTTVLTGVTPVPANLNGTAELAAEIIPHGSELLNHTYTIPELSAGLPFSGGQSSYNINTIWNAPGITPAVRFELGMLTCSGCHTRETNTVFYHVAPEATGFSPVLSAFLNTSGHTVTDPLGLVHTFDEPLRRAKALAELANTTCLSKFVPTGVFHTPLLSTD